MVKVGTLHTFSGWVYFRQTSCGLDVDKDSLAWQLSSPSENCPPSHAGGIETSWRREAGGTQPRTLILHAEKGNWVFPAQTCLINLKCELLLPAKNRALTCCTEAQILSSCLFSLVDLTSDLSPGHFGKVRCYEGASHQEERKSKLPFFLGTLQIFERGQPGDRDGNLAHWALHCFLLPTYSSCPAATSSHCPTLSRKPYRASRHGPESSGTSNQCRQKLVFCFGLQTLSLSKRVHLHTEISISHFGSTLQKSYLLKLALGTNLPWISEDGASF